LQTEARIVLSGASFTIPNYIARKESEREREKDRAERERERESSKLMVYNHCLNVAVHAFPGSTSAKQSQSDIERVS
jgi:hypothetical protein